MYIDSTDGYICWACWWWQCIMMREMIGQLFWLIILIYTLIETQLQKLSTGNLLAHMGELT